MGAMNVLVKGLDAGEGLAVIDGNLVAYAGGAEVGRSRDWAELEMPDDQTLAERFPDLTFSHGAPLVRTYAIDLLDPMMVARRAEGVITCEGRRYPWVAEMVADPVFMTRTVPASLSAGLPHQAVRGWACRVPGQLTGDDPVLTRRIYLALTALLVDLASGRPVTLPTTRVISNVFSVLEPPVSPEIAPALDDLAASRRS